MLKVFRFIISILILTPQMVLSATLNIEMPLRLREKLNTELLSVMRDYNDIEKTDALKIWKELKIKEQPNYEVYTHKTLNQYVKSSRVIDWFSHYQMTGQYEKSANVLSAYFYHLAQFALEMSTHPRLRLNQPLDMHSYFKTVQDVEVCLKQSTKMYTKNDFSIQQVTKNCLESNQKLINLIKETQNVYLKNNSVVNQIIGMTGFVGGNKVEQITENFYDENFINYLAPMTSVVQQKYGRFRVEDFKEKMTSREDALNSFFTANEGFSLNASAHKVWMPFTTSGAKNIYGDIIRAIDSAQSSIFIDMFFIGGSVGASLAKKLIEKVQSNPQIMIYILNDRNNPLGYESELAPVYNYLKAYSEKFPMDRIVILTPEVNLKRTALPPLAESIISDQTLKSILTDSSMSDLQAQLGFYPKAKSDHSKVIVIDGLDAEHGVAYVGSKNFTDSSGAIATDEVTKIQGPIVPVILDSYYYDLAEAMKNSLKVEPTYLRSILGINPHTNQDDKQIIKQLLSPVDVLNRSGKKAVDLNRIVVGAATLQISENDVYGVTRTPMVQYIQMIRTAEKQILISDQFLYDPSIVTALLEAIYRKSNLKVFILLSPKSDESNLTKKFAHIPNISYVENLTSTGQAQIKWKRTPKVRLDAIEIAKKDYGVKLSPEYHLKTLSVDGVSFENSALCHKNFKSELLQKISQTAVVISGSANKDVMTLSGGFREFQVAIFDQQAVIEHDCRFWNLFASAGESNNIDYKQMNLPPELYKSGIDGRVFNQIIRNIIDVTYNTVIGYF